MYILELLIQVFKNKKKHSQTSFDPMAEDIVDENSNNCNHLFMPLDSSNEMFACKYCGLIVPKNKLKNKNIFENKPQ